MTEDPVPNPPKSSLVWAFPLALLKFLWNVTRGLFSIAMVLLTCLTLVPGILAGLAYGWWCWSFTKGKEFADRFFNRYFEE